MAQEEIVCCLHYPEEKGPFNSVALAYLLNEEWEALRDWAAATDNAERFPTLCRCLQDDLPVVLACDEVPVLEQECAEVGWDALQGHALGAFAALSVFVGQAAEQGNAGILFKR